MSSIFNKFDVFKQDIGLGHHDLAAAGHDLKVMLTNIQPVVGDEIFGDITEISAGNGYIAGGVSIENDLVDGVMSGVDVVIEASGGSIGPFQYVVLYNDTQTSPVKPLISWYEHTSEVTLSDTETFTVDFGANVLTIS